MIKPGLLNLVVLISSICISTSFLLAEDLAETEKPQDCTTAHKLLKQAVLLSDGSTKEANLYLKAINKCPSLAEAHYNLGIVYLKQSKPGEAQNAFKAALDIKEEATFHIGLGNAYLIQNKLSESKTAFERAIVLDPSEAKAYQGLSAISDRQGNFEQGLDYLKKAQQFGGTDAITLYNKAVLLEKSGDTNAALELYKRVSEIDRGDSSSL